MPEFLLGAHLDNVDDPPEASYARLRAMRADVVGTLWTNGTRHRRPIYDRLERELGRPIYVVRVGPSGRTTPRQWARDAEDALREVPPLAYTEGRVRVRCLNEVNLPDEGAWAPEEYAAFLHACSELLSDDAPLVAAPISLGLTGWQDWWARFVAACGGSIPADRIAVNCYAHLVGEAAGFAAHGRPVDVTEISTLDLSGRERGRWVVERCRELAAAGVTSAQVFIIGGKSFGAWDERYLMSDDEADEIGRREPIHVAEARPVEKPTAPEPKEPALKTITLGGVAFYDLRDRYPYAPGKSYDERTLGSIDTYVQHHTASPLPADSIEAEIAVFDAAHRWHTEHHGWPALGYHVGIGRGRLYLLNGLTLMSHHARQANATGIGAVWPGDFTKDAPPLEMVSAAARAYRAIEKHLERSLKLVGHYEVTGPSDTSCPGMGHWPTTKKLMLGGTMPEKPTATPPKDDAVTKALDGIWHETLGLAAIEHKDRAVRIQRHVGALKKAIGR